MRHKVLPLYLPADVYRELERRGRAQERDPIQEARYIIRQVLEAQPQQPVGSPHRADQAALEAAT